MKLEIKAYNRTKMEALRRDIAASATHSETHIKQLADMEMFFFDLERNPRKLCLDLQALIMEKFSSYYYRYPYNLPENTREALFAIEDKVRALTPLVPEHEPEAESCRRNFMYLVRMLQDMYFAVDPGSLYCKNMLGDILKTTHIPLYGNLPDEFAIQYHQTLYWQVNLIKQHRPGIFALNKNELLVAERVKYAELKKFLNDYSYSNCPELKLPIQQAVEAISAEIKTQYKVDYHFYGAIMRNLVVIADNPHHVDIPMHIDYLAHHATLHRNEFGENNNYQLFLYSGMVSIIVLSAMLVASLVSPVVFLVGLTIGAGLLSTGFAIGMDGGDTEVSKSLYNVRNIVIENQKLMEPAVVDAGAVVSMSPLMPSAV